jgi:hypothetical protein
MSLPALFAAALDARVSGVSCSGGLVSYVARTTRPWSGMSMGLIAPNILDVGNVGHLAALVAPRPLVFTRSVEPEGEAATSERAEAAFAFCRSVYQLMGVENHLKLSQPADLRELMARS